MATASGIGGDARGNLLPTIQPDISFLGPNYDYSEELKLPGQIGVRRGNSFGSVTSAIKGVNYYLDAIAFGESSNFMTRGLPFQHLGVNYFVKNGQKCSNGADMWTYMELIPKGDAAGTNVKRALESIGSVPLRGLAPGIIEDAKATANPAPFVNALFGSGYAQCKLKEGAVGDEFGKIQNTDTGEYWVSDPKTVYYRNGRAYQKKWILQRNIDAATYEATPKTMNPNGSKVKQTIEKFVNNDWTDQFSFTQLIAILGTLAVANYAVYRYKY
jgi:hypothetical protein